MNGAELTPNLFFREGTGISANQYNFAIDNVGTARSASPTVTVSLPGKAGRKVRDLVTDTLVKTTDEGDKLRFEIAAGPMELHAFRLE